jgi:hypothetical protein
MKMPGDDPDGDWPPNEFPAELQSSKLVPATPDLLCLVAVKARQ